MSPKLLVDGIFLLEKQPGKGGWTYVALSNIRTDITRLRGAVQASGSIDSYTLHEVTLMPLRDSKLFLPVKAGIRKAIGKEAGDEIHLVLYQAADSGSAEEDLLCCLREEPRALAFFEKLSGKQQLSLTKRIGSARTEQEKADRIAMIIDKLLAGRMSGDL